jgi:hypothetical protein
MLDLFVIFLQEFCKELFVFLSNVFFYFESEFFILPFLSDESDIDYLLDFWILLIFGFFLPVLVNECADYIFDEYSDFIENASDYVENYSLVSGSLPFSYSNDWDLFVDSYSLRALTDMEGELVGLLEPDDDFSFEADNFNGIEEENYLDRFYYTPEVENVYNSTVLVDLHDSEDYKEPFLYFTNSNYFTEGEYGEEIFGFWFRYTYSF